MLILRTEMIRLIANAAQKKSTHCGEPGLKLFVWPVESQFPEFPRWPCLKKADNCFVHPPGFKSNPASAKIMAARHKLMRRWRLKRRRSCLCIRQMWPHLNLPLCFTWPIWVDLSLKRKARHGFKFSNLKKKRQFTPGLCVKLVRPDVFCYLFWWKRPVEIIFKYSLWPHQFHMKSPENRKFLVRILWFICSSNTQESHIVQNRYRRRLQDWCSRIRSTFSVVSLHNFPNLLCTRTRPPLPFQ